VVLRIIITFEGVRLGPLACPNVRIARFSVETGSFAYGIIDGEPGREVVAALHAHPLIEPVRLTGERYPLAEVNLGAPVVPSKVVAIGKNYLEHVEEMRALGGEDGISEPPAAPLIFLKLAALFV